MREYAAEMYALVVVYGAERVTRDDIMSQLISNLSSSKDNQAYVSQHGSLLCLGHMIAYLSRRHNSHVSGEQMDTTDDESQPTALATQAVQKMGKSRSLFMLISIYLRSTSFGIVYAHVGVTH